MALNGALTTVRRGRILQNVGGFGRAKALLEELSKPDQDWWDGLRQVSAQCLLIDTGGGRPEDRTRAGFLSDALAEHGGAPRSPGASRPRSMPSARSSISSVDALTLLGPLVACAGYATRRPAFPGEREVIMSIAAKLRRAPVRLATGAYTLNSGLNKLRADEKTAAGVHGMAANAFPVLKRVPAGRVHQGAGRSPRSRSAPRCCFRSCLRAWRVSRSAGSPPGWWRCTCARRVCTTSTCGRPRRAPGSPRTAGSPRSATRWSSTPALSESKITSTEPIT